MRIGNDAEETGGLGTTAEEGKREAWEGEGLGKSGMHHACKSKEDIVVRRRIWFPEREVNRIWPLRQNWWLW